jgi:hypothetical protein
VSGYSGSEFLINRSHGALRVKFQTFKKENLKAQAATRTGQVQLPVSATELPVPAASKCQRPCQCPRGSDVGTPAAWEGLCRLELRVAGLCQTVPVPVVLLNVPSESSIKLERLHSELTASHWHSRACTGQVRSGQVRYITRPPKSEATGMSESHKAA